MKKTILILLPLIYLNCSLFIKPQHNTEHPNWDDAEVILKNISAPRFPDVDYLITDYGAVGDGETDNFAFFKKAIKECNEQGGGRIIVPKGVFLVKGPIHLKSNVHLYLSEGAVLRFSAEPQYYLPMVLTKWEGCELYNYSPFIYAYQATNVAVTGSGTIDGQAAGGFATWKTKQKADQLLLRQMGNDGVPVYERLFGEGHWLRPSMIQPFGCKNVLIEGVTILDSPFWVVHPVFCNNVIVRNINVNSWNTNNDGCDPDASTNVLIENCVFFTGDDGVAIKSGRDQDGWRVGQPTENVIVRDCDIKSIANGLCIGSEMSGGVRNIFMENCRVDSAMSTIYFKSNLDRGGMIENVMVRNIHVKRAKGAVIRFESNYKGHRGNSYTPVFRHFYLENITCEKADNIGIYAEGIEGTPMEYLNFKNVEIKQAEVASHFRFVENVTFDKVLINGQHVNNTTIINKETGSKEKMGW